MSLSIVNSGKFSNTGRATLVCTLGWTPAAGNCLVVCAGDYKAGGGLANPAVTDNQGNSYTRNKQAFDRNVNVDASSHYARNIASSGPFTITFNSNQTAPTALTLFVIEIAGADPTTPSPDTPTNGNGTSTSPASAPLTNSNVNSVIVSFAFDDDTSSTATLTDPGGSWISLQHNLNGSTGVVGSVVYQIVNTSAARAATFTSSIFIWAAITLDIQATATVIAVDDPNLHYSPYNWVKNGSTYVQAYCAGAYVKFGFTGTSLTMLVDVTPLTGGGGTSAANYPVVTATIDHALWTGPTQLTSSTTSVLLASGLVSGTHTAWVFFRGFNASAEAIDQWNLTAPYGALRITGFKVDSGSASAAPLLRGKTMLVYGDSISAGYQADTGPQQAATGDINGQYSWIEPVASAFYAEWGVAAYASACLCTTSASGNNVPGLDPAAGTGYWDHIDSITSRLVSGMLSPSPDIVLIDIGWNDSSAGTSPTVFQARLNDLLSKLAVAAPNAKVFVMQPQGQQRQYAAQFTAASYAANQFYLDLDAGYPNDPYSTGFGSGAGGSSFRSPDGIHLNSVSASELAARVTLAMQKKIGGRGGGA